MKKILLIILFLPIIANSLLLEDIIASKGINERFKGKKIGFMVGSFNPLHYGHESMLLKSIELANLDYALIYPSFGNDHFKKRVNLNIRQKMLFSRFHNHPKVVVTYLNPRELQKVFTKRTNENFTVTKIKDLKFTGIIGSDTALWLKPGNKASEEYMAGVYIPQKKLYNTWDGCVSIPVENFIVAVRSGDSLSTLGGMTGGRKILTVINSSDYKSLSSSKIRSLIKVNKNISKYLSKDVIGIIEKNKLYL